MKYGSILLGMIGKDIEHKTRMIVRIYHNVIRGERTKVTFDK